jgi:uncharacterized protein
LRILIDIGHPAHVHLFRNLVNELIGKGHFVVITAREKDITLPLLESFNIDYELVGRNYSGIWGKIFGLFKFTKKIISIIKDFDADIIISHGSIYAAIASKWTHRYSICLEDTGNKEQVYLYKPFTNLILSPENLKDSFGSKHIKYPSFHESAYLSPQEFVADKSVLDELNLTEKDKYIIVRFVSRKSSHDMGESRLSDFEKIRIVKRFEQFVKVYISSEEELPAELQIYSFPSAISRIHHAMAFAKLFYGESATMCSEAAFLGVPSVLIDSQGRDYTNYLEEKYELVKNFTGKNYNIEKSLDYAVELLNTDNTATIRHKHKLLLQEHINLTDFLFWLITNYPQSINQLKKYPKVFPFYPPKQGVEGSY